MLYYLKPNTFPVLSCLVMSCHVMSDKVFTPKMEKSIGQGFSREWRAGWTDDGGELI